MDFTDAVDAQDLAGRLLGELVGTMRGADSDRQRIDAGFLDELVGEGEATAKALELAAEFARLPAHAYAANKLTTRQAGIEVMKRDLGL